MLVFYTKIITLKQELQNRKQAISVHMHLRFEHEKVKPKGVALIDFYRMLVLFYWISKFISIIYLVDENILVQQVLIECLWKALVEKQK